MTSLTDRAYVWVGWMHGDTTYPDKLREVGAYGQLSYRDDERQGGIIEYCWADDDAMAHMMRHFPEFDADSFTLIDTETERQYWGEFRERRLNIIRNLATGYWQCRYCGSVHRSQLDYCIGCGASGLPLGLWGNRQ